LGSILIDENALLRVSDGLMTEDFYDQRHRWIYEAMLALRDAGVPIDLLTVSNQLETLGHLTEVGEAAYLTGLINDVPTSIHAEHYANTVAEYATRRQVIGAAGKIAAQAYDTNSGDPVAFAREQIAAVEERVPVAEIKGSTWADLDEVIGPIEWAWQDWLPKGFLIEIVGEQETGKSILALRIAACYLRGEPWPDGSAFEGDVGKVLWVEAEASQAVNLERAKAWGLPLENIVHPLADPLEDVRLTNPRHRDAIEALARRPDIRLVLIDSLSGGHHADEQSASGMIPIMKWIAELARDTGKSEIVNHHLRKRGVVDSTDHVTLDRVRGSSGITQLARVVWAVDTPDLNNRDARRLSVIKSNLALKPKPLGFTVDDGRLVFCDAPEPPRHQSKLDEAIEFLRETLADGPVGSTQLTEQAEEAEISKATLKRAKTKLGVKSEKHDEGWAWVLPTDEAV
jgi:KaiC/GvpD/RAD55 family RecA-like ATPase